MQKFKEELVEQVRSGKAQVQVDGKNEYSDLLRHIFPKRETGFVSSNFYFLDKDHPLGHYCCNAAQSRFPIIQAKDFLVQEVEVNWVEVRNNFNQSWSRAILIADIGTQFKFRYFVVEPGKEERFINGESNLDVSAFKYMREIPQPEPLTHSELEKLIGKPFKYVAE